MTESRGDYSPKEDKDFFMEPSNWQRIDERRWKLTMPNGAEIEIVPAGSESKTWVMAGKAGFVESEPYPARTLEQAIQQAWTDFQKVLWDLYDEMGPASATMTM